MSKSLLAAALAMVPLGSPAWADEALARSFFAALEAGDLDAVAALLHEDAVNVLPFTGDGRTEREALRVFDGEAAVLGYFTAAAQRIDQVAFTDIVLTPSADGRTVFAQMRGDMVLPDGRPYRNLYVWRLDFEDGLIVTIHEYFNPVTADQAFGRGGE